MTLLSLCLYKPLRDRRSSSSAGLVALSDMKTAVALAVLAVTTLLQSHSVAGQRFRSWSPWGAWSTCSVTCAGGSQTRYRSCTTSSYSPMRKRDVAAAEMFGRPGQQCVGPAIEIRPCNTQPCPSWTAWSAWSSCDAQCSSKTRTRTCRGPPCPGSNSETSPCRRCQVAFTQRYTTSCGFWGWGSCSHYRTAYREECC